MRSKLGWLTLALLASLIAAVVSWQRGVTGELDREIARSRARLGRQEALRREFAMTKRANAAILAADDHTLAVARGRVAALQSEIAAAEAGERSPADKPVEPFAAGSAVAGSDWKNAGLATSRAALETVLWAAEGGDLDNFVRSLAWLDDATGARAKRLFDRLPENVREQYRMPERLLAALSVPDVPTGSIKVKEWGVPAASGGTQYQYVSAALAGTDGKTKDVVLVFVHRENSWKLAVTDDVVTKYVKQLAPLLEGARRSP